jgi:hypothetical protein
VGFFEHSGRISGPTAFTLPFHLSAVNDVLKSLVITESPGGNPGASGQGRGPSVSYPAEAALNRTLQSLRVDLSGNPGMAELFNSLRGAEIEVSAPGAIGGRIIGVEYRPGRIGGFGGDEAAEREAYLSLLTPQGIRVIGLKEIASFSFRDPELNADLNRALDLIMASRDEEIRNLRVDLPGGGNRDLVLSYVIPTAVWKVSYRLDLSREKPLLQGWAIVDNDGDTDWEGVELSLVTGRPVSFVQNLYAPYHLARPVLPLAIAGTARAETYDSGWGAGSLSTTAQKAAAPRAPVPAPAMQAEESMAMADMEESPLLNRSYTLAGGTNTAASGADLGDQFEFTLKGPVSLARRQSAMLPLIEGTLEARKAVIFSGAKALGGGSVHPAIGVELTNTTGMKLPAGPITVYDGGAYAGDALVEFFPAGEKRFISYGEDLSVSGSLIASNTRIISAVTIRGGVMTLNRKQGYEKVYTLKNTSGEAKRLILEHPLTGGAALTEPASFQERTSSLYRFEGTLPAEGEFTLTVREELPLSERIVLAQLRPESLAAYASNQEIPPAARRALQGAMDLKQRADKAQTDLSALENQKNRLVSEQERIRRNLEAAGSGTQQGQEYLRRLVLTDGDIDKLQAAIEEAEKTLRGALQAYDDYLASMELL